FVQYPGTNQSLNSVFFISPNTGWVGGINGIILKTTNAGNNWFQLNTGTNIRFYSVHFTTADSGWAIGHYPGPGKIFGTTDGGNTWANQYTDSAFALSGSCFVNSSTGWVTGDYGRILYTSNSGVNWYQQSSGVSSWYLYTAFFVSPLTGWVVGNNGTILKTSTGGVVGINTNNNNQMPNDFKLFQNYPNPFNSTTTINFELPLRSFVTLTVTNVLGEEVAVLVNEYKNAGKYEVKWSADNLSSGIYFYTLKTEKFSQTNKLILLK
ncbi:MAG: YCF48-related protein, partial [Ignavibacteria bacterium]